MSGGAALSARTGGAVRRRFCAPSPIEFGEAVGGNDGNDGTASLGQPYDDENNPVFKPPPPSGTSPQEVELLPELAQDAGDDSSMSYHQPTRGAGENEVTPMSSRRTSALEIRTSSASSAVTQTNIRIPSELCCPVCLDAFMNPVTLSCNHNVCRSHVLDLAAAAAADGVLPFGAALSVPCPKCRHVTAFAGGESSIHINVEMKALVEMMLRMLQDQQHQHQQYTQPPLSIPPPAVPTTKPPKPALVSSRSQSRERERRAVTFKDDVVVNGAASISPSRATSASNTSASRPLSSGGKTSTSATATANSVRELEKQLQAERERQREERERVVQAKIDAFKRQRRMDIEARMQQEERLTMSPSLAAALRPQEVHHDGDDEADEQIAEANMKRWLAEESPSRSVEDVAVLEGYLPREALSVEEQLLRLQRYESHGVVGTSSAEVVGSTTATALTHSAKARVAEDRIKHLYQPLKLKTPEERAEEVAREREARRLEERELAAQKCEPDVEVERRLWEVERDIIRQHDQELSRSQMAELAELRARAQIAKFRRAHGGGADSSPARAPTYVPKLNRLQKF